MEINITIPTQLKDITLGQYKKFIKIQEGIENTTFLQLKIIEIFCKVDLKVAKAMRYNDVEQITSDILNLFTKTPNLVTTFKMNGIEYGFVPNLDDMTLGEYIDLDTYAGDYESIEVAMNVLYRPVITKVKHKYIIEDYNPDTKEQMLNMPMDAVISSMFFFLNLGIELSNIILSSSEAKHNLQQVDLVNFQRSMDGISQFMPYLKETLQNLNISLN
tara:strand:- start:1681 stop:2331 length:651 start_codon:yes stop_codon:yes gene_type:complete